jgi:integrase
VSPGDLGALHEDLAAKQAADVIGFLMTAAERDVGFRDRAPDLPQTPPEARTGRRAALTPARGNETAARSAEVLRLDVEDLDLTNRRAKVRRKGGAIDVIVWQTGTARLLPRLLKGRKTGPCF